MYANNYSLLYYVHDSFKVYNAPGKIYKSTKPVMFCYFSLKHLIMYFLTFTVYRPRIKMLGQEVFKSEWQSLNAEDVFLKYRLTCEDAGDKIYPSASMSWVLPHFAAYNPSGLCLTADLV